MTEIAVKVSVPQLDGVAAKLLPSARASLHRAVANEIRETVDTHLARYSPVHHRTAALLGARPTGNLENATVAVKIAHAQGAVVEVGAMGIRRALGPLTITPKDKKCLTIPVNAIAYGRRVADLVRRGIEVFRPKGRNYLAYKPKGSAKSKFSEVLYILAKRAVLKHEPALLPSQSALEEAAASAARNFIFSP